MEGLITKLMNCTADQWSRLASMAKVNAPSMATCQIVFANLRRARRDVEEDRKAARQALANARAGIDLLFA